MWRTLRGAIVTHARLPRVPAHQASGVGGASEDRGQSSGSGRTPAPVGGAEDEGSCPISAGAGDMHATMDPPEAINPSLLPPVANSCRQTICTTSF